MTSLARMNHKIPIQHPNLAAANPQIAFARFIHSRDAHFGIFVTILVGETRAA